MATNSALTNPAGQLATTVSQLYDLAGNSNTPPAQRQSLLLQAHDLRGDLVTLVSLQFSSNTAAYQSVMTDLNTVTAALKSAQQDIANAIGVVTSVGQLAKSIDGLLMEAGQIAAVI